MRRCAASSCGRIEIVPSRRLAAVWLVWLACCLCALLGGIDSPIGERALLGLILTSLNLAALRSAVLLCGSRAVRAVEWDEAGGYRLRTDAATGWQPALLRPVSFRLGIGFLVLWFDTPAGGRMVLIDGGRQDPVAFRRLNRRLARGMLLPSRPRV